MSMTDGVGNGVSPESQLVPMYTTIQQGVRLTDITDAEQEQSLIGRIQNGFDELTSHESGEFGFCLAYLIKPDEFKNEVDPEDFTVRAIDRVVRMAITDLPYDTLMFYKRQSIDSDIAFHKRDDKRAVVSRRFSHILMSDYSLPTGFIYCIKGHKSIL